MALRREARQLDSVHARHNDVRQEQIPIPVDMASGDLAVGTSFDLVAGARQSAGKEAPEGVIVFGQKYAGHGAF